MMPDFEPIAIVGRACVLPGALHPDALFEAVRDARVLIAAAPVGAWGLDADRLLGGVGEEHVASDRGGYVTGFDAVFDAATFAGSVDRPEQLDPVTQWLLHCAHIALAEAGAPSPPPRTGLVIGNLSYPTVGH